MLDRIRETILQQELAIEGEPLWVAVSGGVDSMVLLHALRALGYPCHVAHVDHGLRGADSDADLAFVRDHCREHDIPFHAHKVDVKGEAEASSRSVQMVARELRYAWFRKLVAAGPAKLCLAHHADDAVESMFMGLMQGMGTKGWRSIPYRSGPFIRPMRDVDRAGVLAYAEAHGVTWREDASNTNTAYMRNRVRHELLPLLSQWRPGVQRNLRRNLDLLAEMQGFAERTALAALDTHATGADGSMRIPFEVINRDGIPKFVLDKALRGKGFHPDRIAQILRAIDRQHTGSLFVNGEHQVLVDRSELVIGKVAGVLPSWTIEAVGEGSADLPMIMEASTSSMIDPTAGPTVAWIDRDKIQFPLTLRPWKDGDRLRPVGVDGSKLVSDILIDAKVPRDRKQHTYVLADAERIIWLCGLRLSADVRASASSTVVLQCSWIGS